MKRNNFYDNIILDVDQLHNKFNLNRNLYTHKLYKHNIIDKYFNKLLYKTGYIEKLVDSGFSRKWFHEFNNYWINCLDGRPLKLHDFFFLYSHYRSKFQNIDVTDTTNGYEFLTAYQKPELIYHLLFSVYKYAHNPFSYYPYRKFISTRSSILEYGCGIAPITTSLIRDGLNANSTIADILTVSYHYAKYCLANEDVNFIDLEPGIRPTFPCQYDVIFLMTVMEHLPNPLETLKWLSGSLKPDGIIIFDYILGDGTGLDTRAAIVQRKAVLTYIDKYFDTLYGELNLIKSMGATVIKLRS